LLEEIRLLTNLETSQQKLLQIVLLGQPELDRVLDSPELRQLKQRVALRCQLLPLSEEQTRSYVLSRLERAGAKSEAPVFSDDSLSTLHEYSRGIPRIINNLCENAMVSAFAREQKPVTSDIIAEVAADFRLTPGSALPEETTSTIRESQDNGDSLLRSLFRALRTVENESAEKPISSNAVRRA
jgi:hypothetical protein